MVIERSPSAKVQEETREIISFSLRSLVEPYAFLLRLAALDRRFNTSAGTLN